MYQRPGWLVRTVLNPLIQAPARLGLSLMGAQELTVQGRRSGRPRRAPVNPLDLEGTRYLVAPRGDTHWVRNLRAAGEGELRLGRRRRRFTATEVADAEKPPILRAYLRRWDGVTKAHFGLDRHASDADLVRIAPGHPVFRIVER